VSAVGRLKPYGWWETFYLFVPRALYEAHVAFLAALLEVSWPSWEELAPFDQKRWERFVTRIMITSGARDTLRTLLAWVDVFGENPRVRREELEATFEKLTWSEQHVIRLLNANFNALTDAYHDLRLPYTHEHLPDYVDPRPEAK
jgi:hypothetical protein